MRFSHLLKIAHGGAKPTRKSEQLCKNSHFDGIFDGDWHPFVRC